MFLNTVDSKFLSSLSILIWLSICLYLLKAGGRNIYFLDLSPERLQGCLLRFSQRTPALYSCRRADDHLCNRLLAADTASILNTSFEVDPGEPVPMFFKSLVYCQVSSRCTIMEFTQSLTVMKWFHSSLALESFHSLSKRTSGFLLCFPERFASDHLLYSFHNDLLRSFLICGNECFVSRYFHFNCAVTFFGNSFTSFKSSSFFFKVLYFW